MKTDKLTFIILSYYNLLKYKSEVVYVFISLE